MSSKDAHLKAQRKYDAAHRHDYYYFYVKMKKTADQDIIEFLKTKESMAAYIKELIRMDMTIDSKDKNISEHNYKGATVGNRIKEIRMSRGLTQAQVADRLNLSEKTVSSWEVDRTEPSFENIQQLAKVFSCKLGELLGDSKITSEESVLLQKYNALDEFGKKAVQAIMQVELERGAKQ